MKSTTTGSAASAAGHSRLIRHRGPTRRPLARVAVITAAAALALGVTACGSGNSGGSGSSGSKAPLTVADVAPFTGPDANLGPTYLVACYGATSVINSAGGVDGHRLNCKSVDTRGDPADAVPAVNQMYASSPNLAMAIGCTSDEAASVVPVFTQHKTVSFCMTGQSEFDHTKFPYFFRLVPPDLEESYAMVAIAQQLGYKKIALAFGNDIGSQTFVQPAISAIGKAGMSVVANETLDLKATTFRTEAEKIVSAHPDAIMTEALGTADATLFAEVKQLNGGKMIPIVATSAAIAPAFFKSATQAIGTSDFVNNFHADNLVVDTSGAAYQAFSTALLSQQGKVPGTSGNFNTYLTSPGGVHLYDGINLAALAMIMAKSTDPAVFAPDIIKIGNGVPGAQVCNSFTTCATALKAGKAIRYQGPGGPTNFDAYHDSTGIFQVDTYAPDGTVKVVGNLTADQLRALS